MFKNNYDHVTKETYFGLYQEATDGNPNYFLTYGNGCFLDPGKLEAWWSSSVAQLHENTQTYPGEGSGVPPWTGAEF